MQIIFQVRTRWLHFFSSLILLFTCFGDHSSSEACECGVSQADRIYYGDKVEPGVFPWMALLVTDNENAFCGASLISPKYLITAGHCCPETENSSDSFVTFGTAGFYSSLEYSARQPIEKFIRRSSKFIGKDIAIVKLKRAVFFQPICLPSSIETYANVEATMLGFGITDKGNVSKSLQGGVVTVPSNAKCSEVNRDHISSGDICGGTHDDDTGFCSGDSGGPLMYYNPDIQRWELIGVVSRVTECSDTKDYGIFTRVSKYVDWIQENTNEAGCQK